MEGDPDLTQEALPDVDDQLLPGPDRVRLVLNDPALEGLIAQRRQGLPEDDLGIGSGRDDGLVGHWASVIGGVGAGGSNQAGKEQQSEWGHDTSQKGQENVGS